MYKYIKDKSELNLPEFFKALGGTLTISVDTEASSLDTLTSEWILLQIRMMETIYLFDARTLDRKFLSYLISLINSSQKPVIAHNAKYDIKTIYRGTGILLESVYDTMLSESFIYKGLGKVFYSYQELVEKYAGETIDKDTRLTFVNFKGDLSTEQLSYSALDVLYLEDIYNKQQQFIQERGLDKTISLESDLVPVVAHMEFNGVFVDKDEWLALEKRAVEDREKSYNKLIDTILNGIDFSKYENGFALATDFHVPVTTKKARLALESIIDASILKDWLKESLNINSSKQMLSVLTKVFKLKITSTNEKILKEVHDDKIIPYLLDYREYNKRITTYGSAWLENLHPVTGRVHSEFLQNGTESGRFSSINPNLQQIPVKRKDDDPDYRKPFKAPPGKLILAMDYSQQEYRLAGAISKDPIIIDAYQRGEDMHTATASIICHVPMDKVTKEQRSMGKTVNFAVLYGSTEFGLARNLKINKDEAKKFLIDFYAGYPTLSAFKTAFESAIWAKKYSSTVMGRKRFWEDRQFFFDNKDADKYESRMKREGFNHLIQGTGADITKLAMIKLERDNPFGDLFKLVMQIHDEIVAEVDESIAKEALIFGPKCMVDVFQPFLGNIPAKVDPHLDVCWAK